jgi:hypothetical protein
MKNNEANEWKELRKELPVISDLSEAKIHEAIIDTFAKSLPAEVIEYTTFEVSNQQGGKGGMFKQIKLKKRGVKSGWPDIQIFWNNAGTKEILFLEVKSKKGKVSDIQEAMHERLRSLGMYVEVVRSVDDALAALDKYNFPCGVVK